MRSKHSIRKEFKSKRLTLVAGPALQDNILKFFKDHVSLKENTAIGAYYAKQDEIDLSKLITWLHAQKIPCALPKISSYQTRDMDFLLFKPNTPVKQNDFGINEPYEAEIVTPNIIILPIIACDLKGNRLGYGLGYYDKYLAEAKKTNKNIIAIAICHEAQIYQETLPNEPHDQKLDFIITDRLIYKISN